MNADSSHAGVGVLSPLEAAALFTGVLMLLRRRRQQDLLWLLWLVLFPVAASLTREGVPHALRSIVALPAILVVAGYAIAAILKLVARRFPLRTRALSQLTALALLLSFLPFAARYYYSYARRAAANWQYGVEQALEILDTGSAIPAIRPSCS